jgi:16S rRNA (cytidine1402-2'-O)-methyltransferase
MLSIVSTPIGNLEDITMRALRVMRECDYVLCEDTRVTGKLLHHYDIKKPLRRYDAHAGAHIHAQIIEDLMADKNIVLVSDAGTPGVSDPGVLLVQRARLAGASVEVVPGPSAVTAAVALAGISGNKFAFWGYVPHKKGRETFFSSITDSPIPVVFFESTHRIMKALDALATHCPDAKIYLGRELTKMHEELLVGSPRELFDTLNTEPVRQKGEFVVIVEN